MAVLIINMASDLEGRNVTDRHLVPTWILRFGLLLGVVASVVGYIGCFSVVQGTQKSTGPLSWLCLEAALSLLRMYIWSLNPQSDDAPPLELVLALDDEPPLPTCNKYSDYIDEDKVLPLTRADQFFNSIISFAGFINPLIHPDLTLYYTLTRTQVPDIESATILGQWVLYIAVFDQKELNARVYTRDTRDTPTRLRAMVSTIPAIDHARRIFQAELGEIIHNEDDPILRDNVARALLEDHYQSIMRPYSAMDKETISYVPIKWTMKRVAAAHQESWARPLGGLASTVKPSDGAMLRDTWQRDQRYLELERVERMLGMLYTRRGKWVESYMRWVMRETRERFEGRETVRRVDGDTCAALFAGEPDAKVVDGELEKLLIDEWRLMELLLVYEVESWEEQLWERRRLFVGGSPEKERLTREWRANCWKRLDANILAMDARMDAAKTTANSNEFDLSWNARNDIQQAWRALVDRFMGRDTYSPSMPLQRLIEDIGEITKPRTWWPNNSLNVEVFVKQPKEMLSRSRRELQDIEERLTQGLERCDQFWVDEQLLGCRHSQSRILILNKPDLQSTARSLFPCTEAEQEHRSHRLLRLQFR